MKGMFAAKRRGAQHLVQYKVGEALKNIYSMNYEQCDEFEVDKAVCIDGDNLYDDTSGKYFRCWGTFHGCTQILCREALMFDKFGLVAAEFLCDVQVRQSCSRRLIL